MRYFFLGMWYGTALLLSGCSANSQKNSLPTSDLDLVSEEVERAVWAFHQADTSKDAEQVINLMWPECTMLIDGHRIGYQEISEASRQFMSNLSVFHTDWKDLKIVPLSNQAAVASFIFQDSMPVEGNSIESNSGLHLHRLFSIAHFFSTKRMN